MKIYRTVEDLKANLGAELGPTDLLTVAQAASTVSPSTPRTTSGSTSTPNGRHRVRSAARSRTAN
ncbi:hypothetical protein [Spirillospora sp. NPDC048819]|uniref:hypothetical protein n=1 Tax=Spirillospora sp. NPDC048819 TaxID=3155268 RepID=UPI0033F19BA3